MSRKSQRFLWKQGDGDGKKDDAHPKLYDEPPRKLVEGDESTYPPKYVELSSMWVYQVVRCPFISQEVRYQRWPSVFPSKDPLRVAWINKGLAPKDVRQVWVYPIIFGKYQLHGEEGTGHFDIDQSSFIDSTGTNDTHDIREGATCIIQEPPAFASSLSSDGLAATAAPGLPPAGDSDEEKVEPTPKRRKVNTRKKSKIPAMPIGTPSKQSTAPEAKEPLAPKAPVPKAKGAKKPHSKPNTLKAEPKTPTKFVISATGGKRFVIDDSDSEEKQGDAKTEASSTALKLEKAYYEKELEQAQGKVVLLAAALHGTWTLLGAYNERMVQLSAVYRKWAKGPDETNVADFQKRMDALSDNKDLNNALLLKANAIFNEISEAFPALERRDRKPREEILGIV